MGTWDTSLYGGDLPLDIKDEYYEQLYEGHTPEEAAALVWKELRLGEEDLPVFRLILADVQWKLGQMTEDTLRNALEVLDNGGGDGGMGRSQRVGPPQSATCAGSAAQEAGIPPGAAQNSKASQTKKV